MTAGTERIPALQAVLLVAGFAARQVARSRKTTFLALLSLAPAGLSILLREVAPPGEVDFLREIMPNLYVLGLIQVTCLFYGGSLVRDGLEDHTLVFLLTRPLGRVQVVFGLYLGMVMMVLPLVMVSVVTAFVATRAGLPLGVFGDPGANSALVRLLIVLGFGVFFYAALYTLFGLAFRWPTILALVFLLVVEAGLGSIPGPFRAVAPSGFLESLLLPDFQTRASIDASAAPDSMKGFAVTQSTAILVLGLLFAAIVVLTTVISRRRDFLAYQRGQGGE